MQQEINLDHILKTLLTDCDLHARWLNTFSLLEYIGFGKIVKSQNTRSLDAKIMGHAIEEGRHALLLKKLAIKQGGARFNSYGPETLLCSNEAQDYFHSVDRSCERLLSCDSSVHHKSRLIYLYVTWLVEERALQVYRAYRSALEARRMRASIDALLKEEENHLDSVARELRMRDSQFALRALVLKRTEDALYRVYQKALSNVVLGTGSDR